ncbi:MAG: YceI family protein [Flavobacteriales bacterium]|jgi:polyisoprenoid-binding protein YceI|nr:YceI family protein [Flavobacteriales bacterium]
MNRKLILFGLSAILLASCGGQEETEENPEAEENTTTQEEVCTYSYDEGSTVLTWTAFKLTEKVGVNGSFDEINVTANDGAEEMMGVLSGATFEIPVQSVNSQDEVRDPKIREFFFGKMAETTSISGEVTSINETEGTVMIKMNGKEVEYAGDVVVEGEAVTLTLTIDITDFEAQDALDALGEACAEKHTGPDGVTKFWTDVDIAVKTTLVKECE